MHLEKLGLLTPHLIADHCVVLDDTDIQVLAENRVNVLHCIESNMKLASGLAPVQALIDRGVNVCMGTDGSASNNDVDMFGEMSSVAKVHKGFHLDPTIVSAETTVKMATINGARALGLSERIGSLEAGKEADMVALDLGQLNTQPLYNPISQIVYAAGREQVSDVWVAGQQLLKERRLTTLDDHEIMHRARLWQERIGAANRTGHAGP